MNWIDYTILGVLGLSVLVGLWRGLVSEVLALAIWIAAFWVAWLLGPTVSARLDMIGHPALRVVAGYALCFVLVLVLGALLRFLIHRLLESTGLSGTDRLFGMVFGLARGVLLVCVLVFLCQFTAFTREPPWRDSLLLPPFQRATIWLGQQVPPGVREHLQHAAVSDALHEHLQPAAAAEALRKLPRALSAPSSTAAPAAPSTVSPTSHP